MRLFFATAQIVSTNEPLDLQIQPIEHFNFIKCQARSASICCTYPHACFFYDNLFSRTLHSGEYEHLKLKTS